MFWRYGLFTNRLIVRGWVILLACWFLAAPAADAATTTLAHFADTDIRAIKVDATGNIYVAGLHGTAGAPDTYHAFVAKLSPDGSKILYSNIFGGSQPDFAVALDIDSSGAAYILGQTQSPGLPNPPTQVFVAKVDARGNRIYYKVIGDGTPSRGGILVDASGNAVVSGDGFVVKVDATGGKILASVSGISGRVASDDEGSIYVAGVGASFPSIAVTPGAFQSSVSIGACGGGGQLAIPCFHQYVAKLDASLAHILYATYLSGLYGARPAAIFVDSDKNVLLAGTTYSPDYPTTPDAFQPLYIAHAPPPPQGPCIFGCVYPPPASGYVTKLNASGTGLVYSTFLSGTQLDTINFAAVGSAGIYLSGAAGSADFPGLDGIPQPCLQPVPQTYVTRLANDGSAPTVTRIAPGNVLAYDPVTDTLLAWTGADLISFDSAAPPSPIACILDAADLRPVTAIAPGELLSIFGQRFVDGVDGALSEPPYATSLAGVTVSLNGIASPLLYVSPSQIDVQVPYEIAYDPQVNLSLSSTQTNVFDSRTLSVVARNPVAFLDTVSVASRVGCRLGQVNGGSLLPLAFNSDGSRNTCLNPAPAGGVVRIFLAGLGLTASAPPTGSLNPDPPAPLDLSVTFYNVQNNNPVHGDISAATLPGAISGVWQADLRVLSGQSGAVSVSLAVDSVPVRDMRLTLWISP